MNNPAISIIIPVRNEGARAAKTILSFAAGRSHLFPVEFVIVDDASGDGCCDNLQNLLGRERDAVTIKVIKMAVWRGIPLCRNTGAFAAQAPILFITDANVEACAGWDIPVFRDLLPGRVLCATIADMASSWRGYGCTLHIPSMGTQWLASPDAFGGLVPVAPEAATVIHSKLFRRLGGYDTGMPAYGASEPEFSVRVWLSGAEIVAAPGIVLKHRFRPAAERRPFMKMIEPLLLQNYLRFGLLYLNEPGIVKLMAHYSGQSMCAHFSKALRNLEAGDIWQRRRHLRQQLKYDFGWYSKCFGL
jgi:glycosyltransferase involved in cell wall biosynthesis